MARPKKKTLDYFPHIIKDGTALFILESRWGNDGYAFLWKLLEMLAQSNGYYINLNDNAKLEFLSAKAKLPNKTVIEMLDKLATIEKIDKSLWEKHKIIWCQDLIDSVSDLFKRRGQVPEKPKIKNKGVMGTQNPVMGSKNTVMDTQNPPADELWTPKTPQNKIKENKIKEKKSSSTARTYHNSTGDITSRPDAADAEKEVAEEIKKSDAKPPLNPPEKVVEIFPAPKPDDPDYQDKKELHLLALKLDASSGGSSNAFEGDVLKIPNRTWQTWLETLGILPHQLAQACAILDIEMAAKNIKNPLPYASKVLMMKSQDGSLLTWMRRCKPQKLDVSRYVKGRGL